METVKKNRSGTTDLTVGRPLAQILRLPFLWCWVHFFSSSTALQIPLL